MENGGDDVTKPLKSDKEDDEDPRQKVELRFMAPEAGKYSLQLSVMSNCWIGCDKVITAPLVVEKLNTTEREARENAKFVNDKLFDDSDASEDEDEGGDGDGEGSDTDYSYDSDETGTDVSGDEDGDVEDDDDEVPDLVNVPGSETEPGVHTEEASKTQ